jgi:hypothetical protein
MDAANENGWTALMRAAMHGHTNTVNDILAGEVDANVDAVDANGCTALMHAARRGHTNTVNALAGTHNANVEAVSHYGRTALMLAARFGHADVVHALAGTHNAVVEAADLDGRTALMWAARGGHTATVNALAGTYNANVEPAGRHGWTALMLAARYGHTATVNALAGTHNANVEAVTMYGRTALMYAAWNGRTDTVNALVDRHRANVHAVDRYGLTALDLARPHAHTVDLLAMRFQDAEAVVPEQPAQQRGVENDAAVVDDVVDAVVDAGGQAAQAGHPAGPPGPPDQLDRLSAAVQLEGRVLVRLDGEEGPPRPFDVHDALFHQIQLYSPQNLGDAAGLQESIQGWLEGNEGGIADRARHVDFWTAVTTGIAERYFQGSGPVRIIVYEVPDGADGAVDVVRAVNCVHRGAQTTPRELALARITRGDGHVYFSTAWPGFDVPRNALRDGPAAVIARLLRGGGHLHAAIDSLIHAVDSIPDQTVRTPSKALWESTWEPRGCCSSTRGDA